MLILGLLGMYFDAAMVFVTSQTLLLRLALAILCNVLAISNSQLICMKSKSIIMVMLDLKQ
jgi:hypothetical protein